MGPRQPQLMMATVIITDQFGSQHTWQSVLVGKNGQDIQDVVDNAVDEMLLERGYIPKTRQQKRDELARFKKSQGGNE